MKRILILASALLLAIHPSCNQDDEGNVEKVAWNKTGLDGKNVRELRLKGSQLFAATDEGLFVLDLVENGSWEESGFAGKEVRSILIQDQYMLASVVGTEDPKLYRSEDEGATWTEVDDNFGGDSPEPIFHLSKDPDSATIYATGYAVVARSTDEGLSWSPIRNDWQGFATGLDFVDVNPHNGDLWAGGQNAIEEMVLIQSQDEGASWEFWSDLVDAPSVAKDILFDEQKEHKIYVGFEGALLKTEDNGDTWQTLIESEENRFFFGISQDPAQANTLYAAGWLKRFDDPQPLILFLSEDGGTTWNTHEYPQEDFGGVNDMILTEEGGKTVLYLALWKGGVYRAQIN